MATEKKMHMVVNQCVTNENTAKEIVTTFPEKRYEGLNENL